MNRGSKDLEHLISRFLDREIAEDERRALEDTVRGDAQAARLFAQTAELDRRVGAALRSARDRATLRPAPWRGRRLPVRWVTVGVAASLAGLFLLVPPDRSRPAGRVPAGFNGARTASLFAAPALGDTYVPDSVVSAPPQVRLEETERDWLVIPGPQPGEFLVVEVKRTQIRKVGIQQDF
jgi:anti-sigma factor RsiW